MKIVPICPFSLAHTICEFDIKYYFKTHSPGYLTIECDAKCYIIIKLTNFAKRVVSV